MDHHPELARLAQRIATDAHSGQVDKIGAPYISHPRRVSFAFDPFTQPYEHAAAWLHDVIEDTDITADDLLASGVPAEVVEAVVILTRRKGLRNEDYYAAIRTNPIALAVKLADIDDNTALWRVAQLDETTRERLARKYEKAREVLGDHRA